MPTANAGKAAWLAGLRGIGRWCADSAPRRKRVAGKIGVIGILQGRISVCGTRTVRQAAGFGVEERRQECRRSLGASSETCKKRRCAHSAKIGIFSRVMGESFVYTTGSFPLAIVVFRFSPDEIGLPAWPPHRFIPLPHHAFLQIFVPVVTWLRVCLGHPGNDGAAAGVFRTGGGCDPDCPR